MFVVINSGAGKPYLAPPIWNGTHTYYIHIFMAISWHFSWGQIENSSAIVHLRDIKAYPKPSVMTILSEPRRSFGSDWDRPNLGFWICLSLRTTMTDYLYPARLETDKTADCSIWSDRKLMTDPWNNDNSSIYLLQWILSFPTIIIFVVNFVIF